MLRLCITEGVKEPDSPFKQSKINFMSKLFNQFRSLVRSFHAFLDQLSNSIRLNGIFIFLSLIFPAILSYFDAGRIIILRMEDESGLIFFLTSFAFALLAFSIWSIPTHAIRIFFTFSRVLYGSAFICRLE